MKNIFTLLFVQILIFNCSIVSAQPDIYIKIDTLRYLSVGYHDDTLFSIMKFFDSTTVEISEYRSRNAQSTLAVSTEQFTISNMKWRKIHLKDTFTCFSVAEFNYGIKTYNYFSALRDKGYYYEYVPVKKVTKGNSEFYIYNVNQMLNRTKMTNPAYKSFHIVFNFKYGMIYTDFLNRRKILKRYDWLGRYFKTITTQLP